MKCSTPDCQFLAATESGLCLDCFDADREPESDTPECLACGDEMKPGDLYYKDVGGGVIHDTCLGPERECYVGPDGEPLKDGDPIPEPLVW